MPTLAALNLSFNGNLSVLPDGISNLVSLQYLNLSHTAIQQLPKGLQELKKLVHLDLEETPKLCSAGISSLHNLKVLKLFGSTWDLDTVKELKALKHLEVLTTIVTNWSPAKEQYLSSDRLMSCTKSLEIRNLESSGISLPETMDKLRKFSIHGYSISEIKMGRKCSFLSLVQVRIENCKGLRELTFLMFAPNLRVLSVEAANELEDIINKEKACKVENEGVLPFPKLSDLRLVYLRQLKNIYWSPLPFPCLNLIAVANCPNLKKLPLHSKSGKHGENGLIIRYKEKKWIDGVEWEDEATKTRFLSSCEESPDMNDF